LTTPATWMQYTQCKCIYSCATIYTSNSKEIFVYSVSVILCSTALYWFGFPYRSTVQQCDCLPTIRIIFVRTRPNWFITDNNKLLNRLIRYFTIGTIRIYLYYANHIKKSLKKRTQCLHNTSIIYNNINGLIIIFIIHYYVLHYWYKIIYFIILIIAFYGHYDLTIIIYKQLYNLIK